MRTKEKEEKGVDESASVLRITDTTSFLWSQFTKELEQTGDSNS